MPKTSRTRNGALEETVSPGLASASSTRTCATGAGPSVVPAVVVGEDLLVRPALVREPERAVLAHADPVAPPAAAQRKVVARHGRRGGGDGAGGPTSAAPARAVDRPMRAKSVRRMVLPPAAEASGRYLDAPGLLYRTFNSARGRFQAFSAGSGGTRDR